MAVDNKQKALDIFAGTAPINVAARNMLQRKRIELESLGKTLSEEDMVKEGELILKLLDCHVTSDKEYPPNNFLFEVDGAAFITQGDLFTIGGKQKSGKTTFARLLMAASISGSWNRLKCIECLIDIVYLDSEMKPVDTQNTLRQVAKLAGVDAEIAEEHLFMYNLRAVDVESMKKSIRLYLDIHHPAILMLDGIVDFCPNFNDVEASQELVIEFLSKLAEEYRCAIINILHTNKTDNYTELRGHLGAFLEQKGGGVVKCYKDEKSNIVTVSLTTVRYAPVPDWHFAYDADGMPIDAETLFLEQQAEAAQNEAARRKAENAKRDKNRKDTILSILHAKGGTAKRRDVQQQFMNQLKLGESIFKDLVKEMRDADEPELYEWGPRNKRILSVHPEQTLPGLTASGE